ncbi:hypothetical protein J2S43_002939 [Catenuloplanes nepalensis]|uniref:Uncharacterized protein n=1 Tax=Catenuloplanes nepalensis TaxID=587533 RepID=A0ABT9MSL0_9ACTN|nr:hypothetical protein [Catenuloplanes nepalensis]MDP9794427.1 hypothetical protein [Catenuloplanes nepalensis]
MRTRVPPTLALLLLTCTACTGTFGTNPPRATASAQPGAMVLDRTLPGWTVEAWLKDDSGFCVRAIDPEFHDHGGQCLGLGDLAEPGPPALGTKPVPQLPIHDYARDRALLIGTVRGKIAEVTVTMAGHAATGAVTAMSDSIGAYAVWLPAGDGVGWEHITGVVGYDAGGDAVTWISD